MSEVEVGARAPRVRESWHVSASKLHGHLGDSDLDAIVATLAITCRVPMAVVNIVTPGLQTYVAEVGVNAPFTNVEDRLSFCAQVVKTGQSLEVIDANAHRTFRENPMVRAGAIRSYAGEPLVVGGEIIGSVAIFDSVRRTFTEDELTVLRLQSRLTSAVLALRDAARKDYLTGLPNRALVMDRLDHALERMKRARSRERVAVLFIDLDDFKGLNDQLGHLAGDERLKEVAERLVSSLRPGDTLGRLGGDEFVVVCEDLKTPAQATLVARRLISAVQKEPSRVNSRFPIEISVGVALAQVGEDPDHVVARADAAMYRAKQVAGSAWELDVVEE